MKQLFLFTLLLSTLVFGDDDYSFFKNSSGVKPATDETYLNEFLTI